MGTKYVPLAIVVAWIGGSACDANEGAAPVNAIDAAAPMGDAGDEVTRTMTLIEGLALGQRYATKMVSDGQALFLVRVDGSVIRVPVTRGPMTTLVEGHVLRRSLSVDDANIYYVHEDGEAYRAPKTGGPPIRLSEGAGGVVGMAVSGSTVYWVVASESSSEWVIKRASIQGGPAETFATIEGGISSTTEVVATSTALFVLPGPPGQLTSVPFSAPVPVTVPGCQPGIIADDTAAYCNRSTDVWSVLPDGTITKVSARQDGATDLGIDATDLYWMANGRKTTLMKVAKQGGVPTVVADASFGGPVAVDREAIYFFTDGKIVRRLK